jgi:hypothetical protein
MHPCLQIYENKSSGNQFSILQSDYLEVNKTLEWTTALGFVILQQKPVLLPRPYQKAFRQPKWEHWPSGLGQAKSPFSFADKLFGTSRYRMVLPDTNQDLTPYKTRLYTI